MTETAHAQQELVEAEYHVARARAAVAAQQRTDNITAYRAATKKGRELDAEYRRLSELFFRTKAEAEELSTEHSLLVKELEDHNDSEPDAIEDFPSEEEQAAWKARVQALTAQRDRVLAQAQAKYGLQARHQIEAVKAQKALENQRAVVRNLKNKIDDPNGEVAVHGWVGGVTPI